MCGLVFPQLLTCCGRSFFCIFDMLNDEEEDDVEDE